MDASIGRRIAETRKRAGVSVEDLAAGARILAVDLLALEEGRPVDLSTAAVARLARVLDVDLSDWAGEPVHASQPSLFFLQSGVPDFFDADRSVVVDALRESRSIAAVDAVLERRYKRAVFEPVAVGAVAYAQGYELAQHVRQVLGIPVEPLGSVSQLVEDEFGVPVLAGELHAPNLLALTAKERDTHLAAVIVNGTRQTSRRVDIAHELAHVLFDVPEKDIDYWIDLENDYEAESSKTEQRAKAFAAEFLIPRKGLVEMFGPAHERGQNRSSLAASRDLARQVGEHFRTPPELTTNHLVNHQYIATDLREAVWEELTIPPWRPPARRPKMLHRRLAEALQAVGLSARDPLPKDVRQS